MIKLNSFLFRSRSIDLFLNTFSLPLLPLVNSYSQNILFIKTKSVPFSNSNWTEWSAIQGVIGQAIQISRARRAWTILNYEHDYPRIVRHEVQLLINRFNNKIRD